MHGVVDVMQLMQGKFKAILVRLKNDGPVDSVITQPGVDGLV